MQQGAYKLSGLLKGIAQVPTDSDCTITSLTLDSREVTQGALFVALKGTELHGLSFVDSAIENGAVAVIWESDNDVASCNSELVQIEIKDLRGKLGLIADRFFLSPSQSLNMIGITGTDGKTSVSHFIAQALEKSAVIGTIGIGALDDLQTATLTTPDAIKVHKNLAKLKLQGVANVAMEVSSHALDQGRVANVDFDIAVLTNLSRDHLDYHGTVEAYAEAKEKLFAWPDLKAVVLNLDDEFGRILHKRWGGVISTVIGYGIGRTSDYPQSSLVAENASFNCKGISAQISYQGQKGTLEASVLGRFNLSNMLAALGSLLGLHVSLDDALEQLNTVHTVAGRMDKVSDSKILVVVDYAHTPNALETVLTALREHTDKKLICVFGCGGDRDKGKRPLMAAITEQLADIVIVTDDNPRSENPIQIVKDIVTGFDQPEQAIIEHDRANAIRQALIQAENGDTVLIAGKGHESVQILATGAVAFNDRECANNVLQELAA